MSKERLVDVLMRLNAKKEKVKKFLRIKSKPAKVESRTKISAKAKIPAAVPVQEPNEEQKAVGTKYYVGTAPEYKKPEEFTFPQGYGDNKIVVMIRDPWWIFAYWEITHQRENEVRSVIGHKGLAPVKSILRVYDVTDIAFDGKNAHKSFDIDLAGLATSWYINVGTPNRAWVVDIGILASNNEFFVLARSNVVRTPRFGMSEIVDEEWMCQEDEYWKIFGLSGGFGMGKTSLAMKDMFKKRLMEQVTSGGWSGSVSSFSSPTKKKGLKKKGFWLVVDCELIVYGQTEPDAKVTMQGMPLQLKKDGSFSMRFALPDGKQEIPVIATSFDGDDTRSITPIVTRRTV